MWCGRPGAHTWEGRDFPDASVIVQCGPLTGTRAISDTACPVGFQAAIVKEDLPVDAAQTLMLRQLAAVLQLQCSMASAGRPRSLEKAIEIPASTCHIRVKRKLG